jgi:mannan endo-1,4-beta-mannosidase
MQLLKPSKKYTPARFTLLTSKHLAPCATPTPRPPSQRATRGTRLVVTHAQQDRMNQRTAQAYKNLRSVGNSQSIIFGHQAASLTGIGANGNQPFGDGDYKDPFTSDLDYFVGQHPGMIGIDVWDFAMKNPTWNQKNYARALRDFYDRGNGGLLTLDWHMRGCDTALELNNCAWGVPGNGFYCREGKPQDNLSQKSCACRIVNEEFWRYDDNEKKKSWKDWFLQNKLEPFYCKLKEEGLLETPILFRPFHEQTGNWFWWGSDKWACNEILGKEVEINGYRVIKDLYRMTVRYLRDQRGLRNLIFVFNTDKLHDAPRHRGKNKADLSVDDLVQAFDDVYPGPNFVDVVGVDLYWPKVDNNANRDQEQRYTTQLFKKNLRAVTKVAQRDNKVAALTETGNWNLHNEAGMQNTEWFTKTLDDVVTQDDQIKLAYVLFWQNRKREHYGYYIPHKGHGQFDDFQRFMKRRKVLTYAELRGFYDQDFPMPS